LTEQNDEQPQTEPQESKPRGAQRRAGIIVGAVCLAVVGAVIAINSDGFAVHSSGSEEGSAAESSENLAPVILDLKADADRMFPLGVYQLACEAGDADGDALTYTWTADQGQVYGDGRIVEWGAPEDEGLFRVSVVVDDGKGGTAEKSASLRVKANNAPEFVSIPSFIEGTTPGQSAYITCEAMDADGDEVTYEWSAPQGELAGQGESVVWLAPKMPGSYVVKVTATDAFGAATKREIVVNVTPSETPRLGRFIVKAIGHDMLDFDADVWDIFIGRSCSIKCVVTEGEEPLTFEWSADVGTLTSDGSNEAVWEAPEERGPATITVSVTEASGNTTTGVVLMWVEDCTCRF